MVEPAHLHVIGFSTPNVSPFNRVCTVGLPSIDSSMNSASCSSTNSPTSLPWRAAIPPVACRVPRCTVSSPGAIAIPRDTPNAAYLSTSSISTYTSTLAFNYESLALLFIVNTDGTGAFIQEVSVALNEVKKKVKFLDPSSPVQHNHNSSCSIVNSHMANARSCDQTDMDQWTELCLCHHKHFSRSNIYSSGVCRIWKGGFPQVIPSRPARGYIWGSAVSSPIGVWGGAPAASQFLSHKTA